MVRAGAASKWSGSATLLSPVPSITGTGTRLLPYFTFSNSSDNSNILAKLTVNLLKPHKSLTNFRTKTKKLFHEFNIGTGHTVHSAQCSLMRTDNFLQCAVQFNRNR
jgi:hypothetical protein